MGAVLGVFVAFFGMAIAYGVLKDVVGLPMPWPELIVSVATLVWACWPSKRKEQG